jgi:hypothetical protein
MEMEIRDEVPLAPDTYGLPEYRVTKWLIEMDGGDVRIACGAQRFGRVDWFYTVVMTPEELRQCLQECDRIAGTAHILEMSERHSAH